MFILFDWAAEQIPSEQEATINLADGKILKLFADNNDEVFIIPREKEPQIHN